jgi:hypothetical protein
MVDDNELWRARSAEQCARHLARKRQGVMAMVAGPRFPGARL